MIDLETLSTNPNATILTIGGVKFDPHTSVIPSQGMYFKVDVDSQTAMGREVMQETIDWWTTQSKEIQEEAMGEKDRVSLTEMVKRINKFAVGVDIFWWQGPLFDYAILQNIYKQLGHPAPWQYWQIRDSRTLGSLVPRDPYEERKEAHNALADCYFQAKKVQKIYKQLGIKK